MTATATDPQRAQVGGARVVVSSLDDLVGAAPEALLAMYQAGRVLDSTAVDAARGLVLAVGAAPLRLPLFRPALRLWSRHLNPWRGVTFESGGTTGTNQLLGFDALRFRCEVAPSSLDGEPALVMRYGGFGHPWPVSQLVDELRSVSDGVALGPSMLEVGGELRRLAWWGLSW